MEGGPVPAAAGAAPPAAAAAPGGSQGAAGEAAAAPRLDMDRVVNGARLPDGAFLNSCRNEFRAVLLKECAAAFRPLAQRAVTFQEEAIDGAQLDENDGACVAFCATVERIFLFGAKQLTRESRPDKGFFSHEANFWSAVETMGKRSAASKPFRADVALVESLEGLKDQARGRAWVRQNLNEGTLADCVREMTSTAARSQLERCYYPYAVLMDQEGAELFISVLDGVSHIAFGLSLTGPTLTRPPYRWVFSPNHFPVMQLSPGAVRPGSAAATAPAAAVGAAAEAAAPSGARQSAAEVPEAPARPLQVPTNRPRQAAVPAGGASLPMTWGSPAMSSPALGGVAGPEDVGIGTPPQLGGPDSPTMPEPSSVGPPDLPFSLDLQVDAVGLKRKGAKNKTRRPAKTRVIESLVSTQGVDAAAAATAGPGPDERHEAAPTAGGAGAAAGTDVAAGGDAGLRVRGGPKRKAKRSAAAAAGAKKADEGGAASAGPSSPGSAPLTPRKVAAPNSPKDGADEPHPASHHHDHQEREAEEDSARPSPAVPEPEGPPEPRSAPDAGALTAPAVVGGPLCVEIEHGLAAVGGSSVAEPVVGSPRQLAQLPSEPDVGGAGGVLAHSSSGAAPAPGACPGDSVDGRAAADVAVATTVAAAGDDQTSTAAGSTDRDVENGLELSASGPASTPVASTAPAPAEAQAAAPSAAGRGSPSPSQSARFSPRNSSAARRDSVVSSFHLGFGPAAGDDLDGAVASPGSSPDLDVVSDLRQQYSSSSLRLGGDEEDRARPRATQQGPAATATADRVPAAARGPAPSAPVRRPTAPTGTAARAAAAAGSVDAGRDAAEATANGLEEDDEDDDDGSPSRSSRAVATTASTLSVDASAESEVPVPPGSSEPRWSVAAGGPSSQKSSPAAPGGEREWVVVSPVPSEGTSHVGGADVVLIRDYFEGPPAPGSRAPSLLNGRSITLVLDPPSKRRPSDSELMRLQNRSCATCQGPLTKGLLGGTGNGKYCHYTRLLHCPPCMGHERRVIPSHLLFRDLETVPKPVCKLAAAFLDAMYVVPCLAVATLNPELFHHNENLRQMHVLRKQLSLMRGYIVTCSQSRELLKLLGDRVYFIMDGETSGESDQPPTEAEAEGLGAPVQGDMYSIRDLVELESGDLWVKMGNIARTLARHIAGGSCQLCLSKGFLCEYCNDPRPIFPFQLRAVTQCLTCRSFYHVGCYRRDTCPKCRRLAARGIQKLKGTAAAT